jgi:hypothetical protein
MYEQKVLVNKESHPILVVLLLLDGLESEADRVDAITQTRLIPRTIFENMPEMRIALGTSNLYPLHAIAVILNVLYGIFSYIIKGRPSAAGIILCVRRKEITLTSTTVVFAGLVELIVLP